MKVPLSWLKEYIDFSLSPQELSGVLTLAGLEVDGIEPTPLKFSGVVVGKVIECEKHPQADRLSVAKVFDGTESFQVVCGAPNCRVGLKTAFARIGAVLKDEENKDFKIKRGKIRDVESFGMLCSGAELGLGTDDDGIMEFGEEFQEGTSLESLYGDLILEITLTPNLGHCMSVRGIARELAALLNVPLKKPVSTLKEDGRPIHVHVQLIDKKQCERFACRVVEGISVAPSPQWLQKRLEAAGIRSINNVVDVGNYVMIEMGQPLHLFDLDSVEGQKLIVTSQTAFKKLETLDDIDRDIPPEALLICDEKKPLSFAGVMGGKSSSVKDTTRNILIEAAYFTPQSIRKTGKWLGLRTDSSQRFEKGIDPNAITEALDRAASLLQEIAGGTICKGVIDEKSHAFEKKKIHCRMNRVNQILGTQLSLNEISELLKRLGIETVHEENHGLLLAVPTSRNDIGTEIDLIEEVARVYGYNNIPKHAPTYMGSVLPNTPVYAIEKNVRARLIAEGLQELMTCDLISPSQAEMCLEKSMPKEALISVLQPSSVDQSVLRASLLPGLLQAVKYNRDHYNDNVFGFEVGRIHFKEEEAFKEYSTAAIVLSGHAAPHHFDPKPKEVDFLDLKGIVENLLSGLKIKNVQYETSHLQNFHPGRQARIKVGEMCLGVIAEVHPDHVARAGLEQKVYFAELNLHDLLSLSPKDSKVSELSVYPGSGRDWTLWIKDEVQIENVLQMIRSCGSRLLENVHLLDLYKSDQMGKDRKSVTFRFFYRDPNKTIAFETVEKEHARLTQTVAEKLKDSIVT